jgi:hypothetical protein
LWAWARQPLGEITGLEKDPLNQAAIPWDGAPPHPRKNAEKKREKKKTRTRVFCTGLAPLDVTPNIPAPRKKQHRITAFAIPVGQ